ncbi:MAG: YhfC family intramembrane metalloprotease [Firmicutes bacterium]|nr:YhfC family intramembrane metalloprotease [Bacillota bacterium]
MIGTVAMTGIIMMLVGGVIIPIAVWIWWIKTHDEKISTVLIGAATWFLFAMVLERLPLYILFNPATDVGSTVTGSVVLYVVIAALLAGIFEETGRLVAFKTVLRKRTNKETGISHGIGHGGFEALFILGITGVQYLLYASMISSGRFQEVIDQAVAQGMDTASIEALPGQLMAITPLTGLMSLLERVFAMVMHTGLSIMVFYAARDSRMKLYVLAILLHALMDVPAALYQKGVLNLYVCEAIIGVYAIVFFIIVYRTLYQKDRSNPKRAEKPDYYVERLNG